MTPNGASGTISTKNLVLTGGTPTNLSSVTLMDLDPGTGSVGVSVYGTYTGALTARGTVNGNDWFILGPLPIVNQQTGAVTATIASAAQSFFTINVAGLRGVRLNAEGTVTGSATVSLWESTAGVNPALGTPTLSASATGAITTRDLAPTGPTPTAGSYCQITQLPAGASQVGVSVSGTYTQALVPRGTVDNVVWFTLGANAIVNQTTGAPSSTIPSAETGFYTINVVGLLGIRPSASGGAVTGEADVAMYVSTSTVNPTAQLVPLTGTAVDCPVSASDQVIKASPGTLVKCLVTVSGAGATAIYDNASAGSGIILGIIPAAATVGTTYTFNNTGVAGITIKGDAANSGLTTVYQ